MRRHPGPEGRAAASLVGLHRRAVEGADGAHAQRAAAHRDAVRVQLAVPVARVVHSAAGELGRGGLFSLNSYLYLLYIYVAIALVHPRRLYNCFFFFIGCRQ